MKLATVEMTQAVKKPCPKPKPRKIKSPELDIFLNSWTRLCLTLLGCIVFFLEFFAGGFEGACKSGAALMQGKEKKIG
jgi:hypothetical protein